MGLVPSDRVASSSTPEVPEPPRNRSGATAGTLSPPVSQRQKILNTALTLMAQRGVDGTSMRDLAAATGLTVAAIYHYFPSKGDLLVAVLAERGVLADLSSTLPRDDNADSADGTDGLVDMLDGILQSMLEVEDFIRLMIGEVMRGEATALEVGTELMSTTQQALERWLLDMEVVAGDERDVPAMARLLRSAIIGMFFEHVAGVMGPGDTSELFRERAVEAARVLQRPEA